MSFKGIHSWFALPMLLLAGGCASLPPPRAGDADFPGAFHLQGRIGVRHGDEGFSGNLHWHHGDSGDEILLLSPLGQIVARIQRDAAGVRLETSDERHVAEDAAELTERVLGWRLPLSGLQFWVTGHPAPDAVASLMRDESMNIIRMRQQEWQIEYRDYRQEGRYVLPTRIVMRHESLELRLIVDVWELP